MSTLASHRKAELFDFIQKRRLAVLCTNGQDGQPQAALMNIAVLPDLSLVFETTCGTRKFGNIEHDPRIAAVIGWDGQETLQYEGWAERPEGRRFEAARDAFIAAFPAKSPDEHWPGNSYFVINPCWLRFSNYYRPRFIEEYALADRPRALAPGWRGWLQRLSENSWPFDPAQRRLCPAGR